MENFTVLLFIDLNGELHCTSIYRFEWRMLELRTKDIRCYLYAKEIMINAWYARYTFSLSPFCKNKGMHTI